MMYFNFSRCLILFLLFFCLEAPAQIVGGSRSPGSPAPSEIKSGNISGNNSEQVNSFNGTFNETVPLGSVKTPGGLSFSLNLNYSSVFSSGDNPPVLSGVPYGEGWSLNIPTITVQTDDYKKYNSNYKDIPNFDGDDKIFNEKELKEEGRLFWYCPQISIPGVLSERFVYKYMDYNNEMVFAPHRFEKFVEARFTGNAWKVILWDGTQYIFELATVNTVNCSNQRPFGYTPLDSNIVRDSSTLANLYLPKATIMTWYCDEMKNDNDPYGQKIYFQYEKYGQYDFFQEYTRQPYVKGEFTNLFLGMHWVCVPWMSYCVEFSNPYPTYTVYKDILLKEIRAIDNSFSFERLELNYSNILGKNRQIPYSSTKCLLNPDDSLVHASDSLYSQKLVYSRGIGRPVFSGWKRFPHCRSDEFRNTHLVVPSFPALNPYKHFDGGLLYYLIKPLQDQTTLEFGEGFLESEILNDPLQYVSGDLYRVDFRINAPFSAKFASFLDINIAAGKQYRGVKPNSLNEIQDVFQDASVSTPIFTTFNQAIKWNTLGGSINYDPNNGSSFFEMVTSNYFIMPNLPNELDGFKIQIGPGNSDIKYDVVEDNVFNSTSSIPDAHRAYYNYLKEHNINPDLKAFQKVPNNFGIGLPWFAIRELYENLSNTPRPYEFWYNSIIGSSSFKWQNKPTNLSPSISLNSVDLYRYSKRPYMLTSVKSYVFHAYQGDTLNGSVLRSEKRFYYENRIDSNILNNKDYVTRQSKPDYKLFGYRNLVILSRVEDVPVNSSFCSKPITDPNQFPQTSFSYVIKSADKKETWFTGPQVLLTKIVDRLGKITEVTYNDSVVNLEKANFLKYMNYDLQYSAFDSVGLGASRASVKYARVKSISVVGANGRIRWEYTYSRPVFENISPINISGFEISHYDFNFGFLQNSILNPSSGGMNSSGQVSEVTDFHGNDNNSLLFGKPFRRRIFCKDTLKEESASEYKISKAYLKGINVKQKQEVISSIYQNPYGIYLDEEGLITAGIERVRYLEISRYYKFSDLYLSSYFVPKKKEKFIKYYYTPSDTQRVENISEFTYYNADSTGYNGNPLFGRLKNYYNRVIGEPSWELASVKTYSPQLPGVYDEKQYFYLVDVVAANQYFNAYKRYLGPASLAYVYGLRNLCYEEKTIHKEYGKDPVFHSVYNVYYAVWNRTPEAYVPTTVVVGPMVPRTPCEFTTGVGNNPGIPPAGCKQALHPPYGLPPGYKIKMYNNTSYYCPCQFQERDIKSAVARPIAANTTNTGNFASAKQADLNDFGGDNPPALYQLDMALDRKVYLQAVFTHTDTLKKIINPGKNGMESILQFDTSSFPQKVKLTFPFDTIPVYRILKRNYYGQVAETSNPEGIITRTYFSYPRNVYYKSDSMQYFCNNFMVSIGYNLAMPIAQTIGVGRADSVRCGYAYFPDNSLLKTEDMNHNKTMFFYDGFGRLIEKTLNGISREKYNYHIWDRLQNASFENRTMQNYTEQLKAIEENGRSLKTRTYFSPLGQKIMDVQQELNSYNMDSLGRLNFYPSGLSEYDDWGRLTIQTNPYSFLSNSLMFPEFRKDYAGFKQISYENIPGGRVLDVYPQDYQSGSHYKMTRYFIINKTQFIAELSLSTADIAQIFPCNGCSYNFYKTTNSDEDGKKLICYSDASGRKIAEMADPTGIRNRTLFFYDSFGKLNAVKNALGQVTRYKTNILGQVYYRSSPDEGVLQKSFDRSGRLIAEQTDLLRKNGIFRTYAYDASGHPVMQSKTAGSNFSEYETESFSWKTSRGFGMPVPEKKYYYGSAGLQTDNKLLPQLSNGLLEENFVAERLTKTESFSEDQKLMEIRLLKYSREGNIISEFIQVNPNGIQVNAKGIGFRINYPEYDLANRPLAENLDLNGDGNTDLQFYRTWDGFGRLKSLFMNRREFGISGAKFIEYNYDKRGILSKKYIFGSDSLRKNAKIDSVIYTADNRLRNTQNRSTLFQEDLFYDSQDVTGLKPDFNYNGNINGVHYRYNLSSAGNYTETLTPFTDNSRYSYKYDGLNRLILANANLYSNGTSSRQGDETFNYDAIGNITKLTRGQAGLLLDEVQTYTYKSGNNQLLKVSPAGPDRFSYNENGSILSDNLKGIKNIEYTRNNLISKMQLNPTGDLERYVYGIDDQRIFKIRETSGISRIKEVLYYLRDVSGRELGVLDLQTNQNQWYLIGREREAMYMPLPYKEPTIKIGQIGSRRSIALPTGGEGSIDEALRNMKFPDRLIAIRTGLKAPKFYLQSRIAGLSMELTGSLSIPLNSEHDILKLPGMDGEEMISINEITGQAGGTVINPGVTLPLQDADTLTKYMHYYIYDHLGNLRLSYQSGPFINKRPNLLIRQLNDYYPSGKILRQYISGAGERYVTTGNERDVETGWDYRMARWSDPGVCRFLSVDPLAGKFPSWSPYSSVFGNPIRFIDPFGMSPDDYTAKNDGTIEVIRTNDKFDRFAVENKDGSVRQVTQLEKNDRGLVRFPDEGVGFTRYGISDKGGDHFVRPEIAAALFGAVNDFGSKTKVQFGDMSNQSGGRPNATHMTHFDGRNVDFRYIRKDGSLNPVDVNNPGFDPVGTQKLINSFSKYGFDGPKSIGSYPNKNGDQLNKTFKLGGHNDHGHLQNFNIIHVKEIR